MQRIPFITLVLGALAILTFPTAFATALQYDRAAVNAGEWWRLFTCQWTHWSASHLAWDLAVFLAIGAVCEQRDRAATVRAIAWSAVAIPLAVHFALPGVQQFRGLSGIDCALFGLLACRLGTAGWIDRRPGVVLAITAAWGIFALKTAHEATTGRAVFVGNGGDIAVVPLAHVVGLIIGTVAAFVPARREVATECTRPYRLTARSL